MTNTIAQVLVRPSGIPQDVWEAAIHCAKTALRNLPDDYGDVTIEITAIARVIMADRATRPDTVPSEGVAVKPLEWRDSEVQSRALEPFGAWYFVNEKLDGWAIHYGSPDRYATRDEAKAAAQSHFDAVIRAALTPIESNEK